MIRTDFHWSDNTDRSHCEDEHQFSRDMSILMLRLSEYPGVIGYAWVLEESPGVNYMLMQPSTSMVSGIVRSGAFRM